MATPKDVEEDAGYARYTYRLRLSSAAGTALMGEWDRCRWVWNQCVAESRVAHKAKEKCGPARLDKMLTGWRAEHQWLRDGGSVPQQQIIRDFAKSRAKALKDIKARLPIKQRAGMPRFKKKDLADPTLNYTRRGFRLKDGRLHVAGGIVLTVVWSRDLPSDPTSVRVYQDSLGHWYASFVVQAEAEPLPASGRCIGIDWGVIEGPSRRPDQRACPPGRPRPLVRLLRRPDRGAAAARDQCRGRYRLGCEGDRDHHQRRPRPPPR